MLQPHWKDLDIELKPKVFTAGRNQVVPARKEFVLPTQHSTAQRERQGLQQTAEYGEGLATRAPHP